MSRTNDYRNTYADITERLEDAAAGWLERSALYGMSSAALLREAKEEIRRLRRELLIEIRTRGNGYNLGIPRSARGE